MGYRFLPTLNAEQLAQRQLEGLKWSVAHAFTGSPFYRRRLSEAGIAPEDIRSLNDVRRLPFTTVDDLRDGYPFPLLSVPHEDVVRIHASSGTTGKRKVLSYTARDIDVWRTMMARCYELAGLTRTDRVQIAVGYGLWTAGVGFQLGCEAFGATALPIGPGNIDLQLQLLVDMQTTCLCSTASMGLLLAERVAEEGLQDEIALTTLIFGAEPHSDKMRRHIEGLLGVRRSFDIPGMTEVYGPGTGLECAEHHGIHYWADMFILEILDPETLLPTPPGEVGEMVVTTLCKEASPLLRYRTRDLTRALPGDCACGLCLPRHDRIMGRSDDMFIVRGVNVYPSQLEKVLEEFPELGSEYQVTLCRDKGRDSMAVTVEQRGAAERSALARKVEQRIRAALQVRAAVSLADEGSLPRTFGKSKRVLDEREEGTL